MFSLYRKAGTIAHRRRRSWKEARRRRIGRREQGDGRRAQAASMQHSHLWQGIQTEGSSEPSLRERAWSGSARRRRQRRRRRRIAAAGHEDPVRVLSAHLLASACCATSVRRTIAHTSRRTGAPSTGECRAVAAPMRPASIQNTYGTTYPCARRTASAASPSDRHRLASRRSPITTATWRLGLADTDCSGATQAARPSLISTSAKSTGYITCIYFIQTTIRAKSYLQSKLRKILDQNGRI